jgi:hypothetical protein
LLQQGCHSWLAGAFVVLAVLLGGAGHASAQGTMTLTLTSAPNPSLQGQPVVATANATDTVFGPYAGGDIYFSLDGGPLTGPVVTDGNGDASMTYTGLSVGNHTIIAYADIDGQNYPTNTITQVVQPSAPPPGTNISQMQQLGTTIVAKVSGAAMSNGVGGAIEDGFSDITQFMTFSNGGVRFNFVADLKKPADDTRVADTFSALKTGRAADYTPPPLPSSWRPWLQVRGTGFFDADDDDANIAAIEGEQVNANAGLGYRLGDNIVVGAFGGYETFDYDSEPLSAELTGDGWTGGLYGGWRATQDIRVDIALGYTELDYDVEDPLAAGEIPGERWFASAGVTGTYRFDTVTVEPSARIFALWEEQAAFTDSLGNLHPEFDFAVARGSLGAKAGVPLELGQSFALDIYGGAYADYYYDDTDAIFIASLPAAANVLEDWSGRIVAGLTASTRSGGKVSLGGELGALGEDELLWTATARGSVPF